MRIIFGDCLKGIFAGAVAIVAQAAVAQAQSVPGTTSAAETRGFDMIRPSGELECLVEPFMTVNVGSPVDGVLEQVTVNRGDRVRKGQVVAKLRDGVEAAEGNPF